MNNVEIGTMIVQAIVRLIIFCIKHDLLFIDSDAKTTQYFEYKRLRPDAFKKYTRQIRLLSILDKFKYDCCALLKNVAIIS